ncbi:MAG: OmpA family protein [Oleiphilaceae bacterium]|nr:OmpA family protein [Oleiphilaceae bacterium]
MSANASASADDRVVDPDSDWNQWSISAMVQYVEPDDDRNDNTDGAGFRFGAVHPLDDRWDLELAAFGNQLGRDQREGRDWQYMLGADVLYFLRDGSVTPYGIAGAGAVFNDFSTDSNVGPYGNLGLGLKFPLGWNRISVRAEARYYVDNADDALNNAPHQDARFFLGIEVPLSEPPMAPAPIVRTEVRTEVRETERVVERIPELQRLDGVKFEFDSDRLEPNARIVLRRVAEDLKVHDHVTVRIEGHTDSIGSAEYNDKLSRERAEAVKQFLVEQGIDEDRITTIGFGLERPIETNETEAGRELNRRIEMRRTDLIDDDELKEIDAEDGARESQDPGTTGESDNSRDD